MVVGTSVGAINGAFIASRPQTVETADELAEIWRGVRRGQVFPLRPLSGLLGFLGSRDHLVPESGLRRLIAEHTTYEPIEQTPIEFHVVAVDVLTGEELGRDSLRALLISEPAHTLKRPPPVCPRPRGAASADSPLTGKTGANHDAEEDMNSISAVAESNGHAPPVLPSRERPWPTEPAPG